MSTIQINGKDYKTEELSDDVKNTINSLNFAVGEIKRLSAQLAVIKTAESAYKKALLEALDNQASQNQEVAKEN